MTAPYSRSNPSPRYRELVAVYRELHLNGEKSRNVSAEEMFPGHSLPRHAGNIKQLISHFGTQTVLDYGSGKGMQYRVAPGGVVLGNGTFDSIPLYWGVAVTCYDPAYPPCSNLPQTVFDATISTDVLEHCPEEDIPWVVDEMFGFARQFLYANVACYKAKKVLPNGENAHTTIRPYAWWNQIFSAASARHGNRHWILLVEELEMIAGARVPGVRRAGTIKMNV